MSDKIITTNYGFSVIQMNKTNNNDKPEEIGISNYLLADNNVLSKKVKSLEHENKVLKRALEFACNCADDVDYLCYECNKVCERQFEGNIECMVEHLIQQAEKEINNEDSNS